MLRGSVAVVGLLVMIVPSAEALGLRILESPAEPLPPGGTPGQVRVEASMDCQELLVRDHTVVTYLLETPPNLIMTGPQTQVFDPSLCPAPTGTAALENTFNLTPTAAAPGLQALPVTLSAFVGPGGPGGVQPEDEAGPVTFEVAADYLALTQLKMVEKVVGVHGRGAFAFTAHNHGNAETRWTFSVEAPEGFQVSLPDEVVGAPVLQGGGPVEVEATASGQGSWKEQAIRITVHSASSADPARTGDDAALNVMLRNEGGFLGMPAAPVAPVLVLLALAAWAARRRA